MSTAEVVPNPEKLVILRPNECDFVFTHDCYCDFSTEILANSQDWTPYVFSGQFIYFVKLAGVHTRDGWENARLAAAIVVLNDAALALPPTCAYHPYSSYNRSQSIFLRDIFRKGHSVGQSKNRQFPQDYGKYIVVQFGRSVHLCAANKLGTMRFDLGAYFDKFLKVY